MRKGAYILFFTAVLFAAKVYFIDHSVAIIPSFAKFYQERKESLDVDELMRLRWQAFETRYPFVKRDPKYENLRNAYPYSDLIFLSLTTLGLVLIVMGALRQHRMETAGPSRGKKNNYVSKQTQKPQTVGRAAPVAGKNEGEGRYMSLTDGSVIYEWDGHIVRSGNGAALYHWDGTYFSNPTGHKLFELEGGIIKQAFGSKLYEYDGRVVRKYGGDDEYEWDGEFIGEIGGQNLSYLWDGAAFPIIMVIVLLLNDGKIHAPQV